MSLKGLLSLFFLFNLSYSCFAYQLTERPVVAYLKKFSNDESSLHVYNAAHNLFIPLHVAARTQDAELVAAFERFFNYQNPTRIFKDYSIENLFFAYLYSEYIRFFPEQVNHAHYVFIKKYFLNYWLYEEGNVWAEEAQKFVGKRQRIKYLIKLNANTYSKELGYLAAITDFDMLALSIGTNLAYNETKKKQPNPTLIEIPELFYQLINKNINYLSGKRILIQQGVWTYYPDYLYAGYHSLEDITVPKVVANIAMDVSHFSRFPIFLNTLANFFKHNKTYSHQLNTIKEGVAKQFVTKVMEKPYSKLQLYRIRNFMDGSNGIFRYNYHQKGVGYAPYENSKHVFFGFWILLDNQSIKKMYKHLYGNIDLYYQDVGFRWIDYDIDDSKEYYKDLIGLMLFDSK